MNALTTISQQDLINSRVEESILTQGISDYLDKNSTNWKCIGTNEFGDFLIDLESIPINVRKTIQLTAEVKPIKKEDFKIPGVCILEIADAYKNGSHEFKHLYQHTSRPEYYGQKHSVFKTCAKIYIEDLKCKRGGKKNLFTTLKQLGIEFYSDLDSFRKFFTRLLECKNMVLEIQHGLIGTENKSRKKINRWHRLKAIDLMRKSSLKTEILSNMNSTCRPGEKISYSTLKRIIDSNIENITKEDRYGYDIYKRDIEPYIRRKKPEYKFQVAEADGSRFQIPFYDPSKKKLRFLTLYVIIDVYSSMIIGFSLAESENTEMILNAFWMMMAKHKYIPAVVLVDNGLKNSGAWKKFQDESNRLFGTLWRKHLPDYPNAKGTVESFFKYFNVKIARNYKNYLGLSFRSKSNDHRLKKDEVRKVYKNKKRLGTYNETVYQCCKLIVKWNKTISKKISPEQKFNQGKIADAKIISEEMIARLCWKKESKTIRRSRIEFNSREYELSNYENINKYNGRKIDCYYHASIPDYVFLFNGDQFIEKATAKPFFDEEDPRKFQKIKHNKGLRDHNSKILKESQKELEEIENTDPLFRTYFCDDKEFENSEYERFLEEHILNQDEIDTENEVDTQEYESDLSSYA